MASEKAILRALDLLTIAPQATLESLDAGAPPNARRMRGIVDSKNVVAVGISEKISKGKPVGNLALTFYVERKIPLGELPKHRAIPPVMPDTIGGGNNVLTDVVVIGCPHLEVKDLLHPLVTRKPVQPGYSIGHVNVTAGTFGALVRKEKQLLILSNNHVLANSNRGKKGDHILYPGQADGGQLAGDGVAELFDFVPLQPGGDFINRVDCAIALPLADRLEQFKAEIKGLAVPTGITKPVRGMEVVKVGRTTGKTIGRIKDIHFRLAIKYPGLGNVGFIDQVFCSRYTNNGDSGSLVLDRKTGKAVGLHFLGYPDAHGVKGSVFNPIGEVLKALGVKLVTKSL
jgi:hypothetical protein